MSFVKILSPTSNEFINLLIFSERTVCTSDKCHYIFLLAKPSQVFIIFNEAIVNQVRNNNFRLENCFIYGQN